MCKGRNRLTVVMTCCIATLLLLSCGGRNHGNKEASDSARTEQRTLPLPEVPHALIEVSERADYVALHFWDALDFSDREALADTVFIEQSFSNYISILPVCSYDGLVVSVAALMDKARDAGKAGTVMELSEKYLWQSDSPFRSERLFTPFVEYAVSNSLENEERYREILKDIRKNAPGSIAPGFTANGSDGNKVVISPQKDRIQTIVMFYDPDCEECEAAIKQLSVDPVLDRITAEGKLRFVAVYVGENKDQWKRHSATLPDSWEVCIDETLDIDDRDLYQIRATPSFYLIGDDGKIIIKDAGAPEILTTLRGGI